MAYCTMKKIKRATQAHFDPAQTFLSEFVGEIDLYPHTVKDGILVWWPKLWSEGG